LGGDDLPDVNALGIKTTNLFSVGPTGRPFFLQDKGLARWAGNFNVFPLPQGVALGWKNVWAFGPSLDMNIPKTSILPFLME
jgi:hypothetical protein